MESSLVAKILCWNVNGIRSVWNKGFPEVVEAEQPDIVCLQETKIDSETLEKLELSLPNYDRFHSPALKRGYSGVLTCTRRGGVFSPQKTSYGIESLEFDSEGRFLITEHRDFILLNVYVPSGTTGEIRQAAKYKFLAQLLNYLKALPLETRERTIVCGDFNICHQPIDIHHPLVAEKRQLSGYLGPERAWIDELLALGFYDSFREFNGPEVQKFSWWSFRANSRAKSLGWRIDYIFLGQALKSGVTEAEIHCNILGSDHCPVSLTLDLQSVSPRPL